MAFAHTQHLKIARKAHALIVRFYVAALRRKVEFYKTRAELEGQRASLAFAAAQHARNYAEDAKLDAQHAGRTAEDVAKLAEFEAEEIGGKL